MRRILLLITDLEIGGTPTVVRELAIRLHAPPAVIVEVACLGKWGPVADQLAAAGIYVSALNAGGAADFRVVGRLASLIARRAYDTVFSFLIHANAVAAATRPICRGVRYFQSIQTTQLLPKWHWWMQRLVHHAALKIVVPSPSVAQAAVDRSGVPREKMVVIFNAVEADAFDPSPIPATELRPFPIGFLGRLDPVKRIPDLLHAVKSLNGLVHLHLFGEGEERSHILKMMHELNLEKSVTLHGAVPSPQVALRRIGLLVLPSISEGFGLVLIEAMAAGVPVVARDVPGVRDVVRDGQTGLLASSLSVEALSIAIARLVNDPGLRHRFIEQGARDVRERFAWTAVLRQYRDVLGLGR